MSIATDLQVHTNHTTTGPPLAAVLFGYDPVGNVASIEDGVAVQTQNFSYDALDRLESASASSGDGAYDEAYQYYRGGSIQRKGDPENTSDGLYDYADLEFHPHAVTGYRGNTYGYDANGNITSRTVDGVSYTLTYDAENRLVSVVGGGSTVNFTYDSDGNRVKKDEDGVVTHYPGRHYESTIGSGSAKYYYAGGQLIAFERSPEYGINYGRRFVFRDHLGSTSVIVNDKGEKLWEDRFYPFGDVRHTYRKGDDPSFPLQTQYRYTSQWFEDGLGASAEDGLDRGLYFYGARWYDSSLGRFIQPDTIVPEPGNPQALNRYSYVLNNALRYTDPSGHYIPIEGDPGDPKFIGVGGTDSNPIVFMPSNYVEAKWAEFFLAVLSGVDPKLAESRVNTRLASWFGNDDGDPTGSIEHSIWNQNPWVPQWIRDSWNQKTGGLQAMGPEVANQGMQGQQGLGLRQQGQTNYFTVPMQRTGETNLSRYAGIGQPGRGGSHIRIVKGTPADALTVYHDIVGDASVKPHSGVSGGWLTQLLDGSVIGYRPISTSGPPTIDIMKSPQLRRNIEIKFYMR